MVRRGGEGGGPGASSSSLPDHERWTLRAQERPRPVEQAIRAAAVQPYLVVFGTNAVGGYDDPDHRFDAWALPAIVALSGNWVGELPANPVLTGGNVAPNAQKMEDVADAMLYVGPRDTLIQVFIP